jgi:hypothetical protein
MGLQGGFEKTALRRCHSDGQPCSSTLFTAKCNLCEVRCDLSTCERVVGRWKETCQQTTFATHAYEGPHTDDAAAGLQVTAKVEERLPEPNSAPSDEAAATEAEEKNRKQAP